jgi:hypothetical protein
VGTCSYCGQPAGLFRSRHADCESKHALALQKIPEFFEQALISTVPPQKFRELVEGVAHTHYVPPNELTLLAIAGIARMINKALADSVLTTEEDVRIGEVRDAFGLSVPQLGVAGDRLVKSEILRDLDSGRIPEGVRVEGGLPINFARGETVIWIFNGVEYHSIKSRTQYVGGSHGVSVRLMKGVYYRVGASRGEAVKTSELAFEASGDLVISSQNVYFVSPAKVIKLPVRKIVGLQAYSDAVQITRDGVNAKPQVFKLDDPWFAANAIARVNQL